MQHMLIEECLKQFLANNGLLRAGGGGKKICTTRKITFTGAPTLKSNAKVIPGEKHVSERRSLEMNIQESLAASFKAQCMVGNGTLLEEEGERLCLRCGLAGGDASESRAKRERPGDTLSAHAQKSHSRSTVSDLTKRVN